MSQTFAPFASISSTKEGVFTPLPRQGVPPMPASVKSVSATETAAAGAGHSPDTCSAPVITLKRNGDTVYAIHIQCACGLVIELNCVY